MYVTLDEAKKHLRIDQSYSGDNTYIEFLIGVAEKVAEKYINTELSTLVDEGGKLPLDLQMSILFYVADLYANRESITYGEAKSVPRTFEFLLAPFRNYDN